MSSQIFKIQNEDDAFLVLEKYLDGTLPKDFICDTSGWPSIKISLKGEKFDQSITPSVMDGFIQIQKAVNKAYADSVYGDPTKRLTEQEKSSIELSVKVEKGSSIVTVQLSEAAVNFTQALVTKMDPTTLAVTIISAGLIWAGRSLWAKHLDNQRQLLIENARTEKDRLQYESMQFMSAQETHRVEVLANVFTRLPNVERIESITKEARTDLLKGLSRVDEIDIGGLKLSGEAAADLTKNARSVATESRFDGHYKILRVDSSNQDLFKVRVEARQTGQIFDAIVQDDSSNNNIKSTIQEAEWSRKFVNLTINARVLRTEITGAVVISAKISTKNQLEAQG